MNNWSVLPESHLRGNGYQNIQKGWRNTETEAEVLIYRVEGTGMKDVTDKEFAVQHPLDSSGENTEFFNDIDEAKSCASKYMDEHPSPDL